MEAVRSWEADRTEGVAGVLAGQTEAILMKRSFSSSIRLYED